MSTNVIQFSTPLAEVEKRLKVLNKGYDEYDGLFDQIEELAEYLEGVQQDYDDVFLKEAQRVGLDAMPQHTIEATTCLAMLVEETGTIIYSLKHEIAPEMNKIINQHLKISETMSAQPDMFQGEDYE
jgi:hypothetical protein